MGVLRLSHMAALKKSKVDLMTCSAKHYRNYEISKQGYMSPSLYCGQPGEDKGRSGRGVQRQVLERHVKAGRARGAGALSNQ